MVLRDMGNLRTLAISDRLEQYINTNRNLNFPQEAKRGTKSYAK